MTSSQALQLPLFLPGMGMKRHECDNWLQNHKSLSPTRRLPPLQLWKLPLMLLDGRHDKFHKCWHVNRRKMKCHVLELLFLQEVEILLLLISSKTNVSVHWWRLDPLSVTRQASLCICVTLDFGPGNFKALKHQQQQNHITTITRVQVC